MITEDQRFQFQQQGYVVLEKILSKSVLGWLQGRCDEAVDWKASGMRSLGIEEEGIKLFENIGSDLFSIQGISLIQLTQFLWDNNLLFENNGT